MRTLLILKSSFVRSQKNPKDEFICYSKCSVRFSWQLVDCTRLRKWLSFMCASHPREVYMPWLLILNGRFSGIGTHSSYSRPRVVSDYKKPSYLVHVMFLHTSSMAQYAADPSAIMFRYKPMVNIKACNASWCQRCMFSCVGTVSPAVPEAM